MGVRMIPTEAGPQMRFPTLNTKWLSRNQRNGEAANFAVVRVHKNGTLLSGLSSLRPSARWSGRRMRLRAMPAP